MTITLKVSRREADWIHCALGELSFKVKWSGQVNSCRTYTAIDKLRKRVVAAMHANKNRKKP